MIKVFWHQSSNFGDKLTPYFLDKLGIKHQYVDKGCNEEHYIICGSILSACNENSIIWGAGLAQEQEFVEPKNIWAVRGKNTKMMVESKGYYCPDVFGDISELLPRIYYPSKKKLRKVGFIPHFIEYSGEGCNLTWEIEEIIDYILESDRVVTSSLHGFLTARAYGIPVEYYTSKNVIGQSVKIADSLSYKPDVNCFLKNCPLDIRL